MDLNSQSPRANTANTAGERKEKLELTIRKIRKFWVKTSMDIATKMEHLMSELNEFQCKQREFHESVIVTDHPGRSPELRKALCNMEFSAQTRKAQFKIMLDREYQIWKQIKFEWFKPLIDADFGNMTMEELHAMVKKCKDGVKIAIEKNDVFKNLMETWTPLKTELCAGMDELRLRVFPPY